MGHLFERRDAIQSQIAKHLHAVTELQHSFNALAPVNNLPVEVLAEIFLCFFARMVRTNLVPLESTWLGSNRLNRGNETLYNWFTIAQVCHHWRAVALSCSRLWGHIYINRPQSVEHLLARSGSAPLTVVANLWSQDTLTRALTAALTHQTRIADFCLVTGPHFMDNFLFTFTPSSVMVRLVLKENPSGMSMKERGFSPHFFENCPNLQHLEITGGLVPAVWRQNRLPPSLKILHITGEYCWSQPSTMEHALNMLQGLPNLEQLGMRDVTGIPLPATLSPGTQASLPRLRKLVLSGSSASPVLLNSLAYGPDVTMSISCMASSKDSIVALAAAATAKRADSGLLRAMSISYKPHKPARVLHIICGSSLPPIEAEIAAGHQTLPDVLAGRMFTSRNPPADGALQLEFTVPDELFGPRESAGVMPALCSSLHLPRVRELQVMVHASRDPGNLRWLHPGLGHMDIAIMRMCGPTAAALPKVLVQECVTGLQELRLARVPFAKRARAAIGQSAMTRDLVSMLKKRRKRGLPVARLKIEGCYDFTADDQAVLASSGAAVEWDSEVASEPQKGAGRMQQDQAMLEALDAEVLDYLFIAGP